MTRAVPSGGPGVDRAGPMTDPERVAWLEARLRASLGDRVRSDLGERALFASDASNYRAVPSLVVAPADVDELGAVTALCGEAGLPLTMRGAGTSIAGNALGAGVLVVTRSLGRLTALDPVAGTAIVEPGVVLDDLNRAAAPHGLRVGPDPSTHSRCTIGGMIGNNACGAHSVRWGTTAESVIGLDVLRSDGSRVRLRSPRPGDATVDQGGGPDPRWPAPGGELEAGLADLVAANEGLIRAELPPWPRRVSGFALDWLLPERGPDVARALVGTEGACAVVARATIRLVRPPAARRLLVLGFADDIAAAEAVPALLGAAPFTVESLTAELLALAHATPRQVGLPHAGAWLMVEARGDDAAEARDHAARLARAIGRRLSDANVQLLEDERAQSALWRIRENGAGHASRLPDGGPAWPGFEDSAVPPERLAGYLRDLRELLREHGLEGTTYGHFGEGCIHLRVGFGLDRPGGVDRFRGFVTAAAELVVAHGGTLSGEHGDGRSRSALLPLMFSPGLIAAFARFKALWDPAGILNPGVVIDPPDITDALRAARPSTLATRPASALLHDGGDLRTAVDRCIGVGRCVAVGGTALMCPSYRATRDERHSTRGRARLLQEMVAGSLSAEGWRSETVREALDLCLACKGCLAECPTRVDMAAYKSEFLYQHYRGRVRPRSHYSLGWLPLWLRLTQRVPGLVNLVTRSRLTRRLFTLAAGIAAERSIPPLARRSFVRARRAAPAVPGSAPHGRVILWPDTFNGYLTPGVAHAAERVLTDAGFAVAVPSRTVCCGLTWYTTGQLDMARRVLRRSLAAPELEGADPVVVLEPSCAAMLRADQLELLPHDPRAAALAGRVTTFAEILESVGYRAPDERGEQGAVARPTLMQPHCHQRAVLGLVADRRVLARNGIDVTTELVGCCGLAGNFGAEAGHEAISRAVADLELVPALAAAERDATILADGFSCRTQIESLSGRSAWHLAEVLAARLPPSP
jgi:FAD/FMN-containing dehydrogenase/Fe-S oxidoreductase